MRAIIFISILFVFQVSCRPLKKNTEMKNSQKEYTNLSMSDYCSSFINCMVLPNLHYDENSKIFSSNEKYFEAVFKNNDKCFHGLSRKEIIEIFGKSHDTSPNVIMYKFEVRQKNAFDYYLFRFDTTGKCTKVEAGEGEWTH